MKIGVIDSGIGGLTVLKTLLNKCPNHEYIYYGDTINLPYGEKSKEEIISFANNIINFLENEGVDIIVLACGTMSSNVGDINRNVGLIDIISPLKGKLDNYKKISVMATPLSIKTNAFKKYINSELNLIPCYNLAKSIEDNDELEIKKLLQKYLKNTFDSDALILGCTHYPLIIDNIKEIFKKDIICLDEFIVSKINKLPQSKNNLKVYFSYINENIEENVKRILDIENIKIERRI